MPWYCVVSQTTKHEGLGGTIGGRASSSFRGRPGIEDQLSRFTMYLAVAFMVLSFLSFLATEFA
jgi:protein translocase SecG subunit